MADPDTNYLTNKEIGDEFFNGETVPSDNTIKEDRNLNIKKRVDRRINRYLQVTTNQTDTYGVIKEIAYDVYERILHGKDSSLTKAEKFELEQGGFTEPPIVMQRSDDFDEPDPV